MCLERLGRSVVGLDGLSSGRKARMGVGDCWRYGDERCEGWVMVGI